MQPLVKEYLDEVRLHLHLAHDKERQIISELYTHFQEKVAELQRDNISEKEAARKAIESFGRARVVARLMYEAYSKGSWADALMTCLPHMIIAALFFSHFWNHYLLAPIAFSLIVGITLFGWWHGKPNWLYSWVGYSLLPLLIVGYNSCFIPEQAIVFLLGGDAFLPSVWLLILVLIFYLLSIWLIFSTTIRVARRDWVLASLMLVPLPIIGCWLVNIEQAGSLFQVSGEVLHQWDTLMASALLVLGITSSTFIRLRERHLKIGALVTLGSLSLTIVAHNLWGDLGFFALLAFALFMLVFLLAPVLLETRIGHGEQKGDNWWQDGLVENPSATT